MVKHVRGYQDRKKGSTHTGRKHEHPNRQNHRKIVSIPKSTHICNTPMANYINKNFIPNNLREEIRTHYGAQGAEMFLK